MDIYHNIRTHLMHFFKLRESLKTVGDSDKKNIHLSYELLIKVMIPFFRV